MGVSTSGMFHRVNDFAFARSAKQAMGFYLFHSFTVLVGMILAVLVYGLIFGFESFSAPGVMDKNYLLFEQAIIYLEMSYVGYLSFQILAVKNRLQDMKSFLAGVAAIALTMQGLLIGMLVVACLSVLLPLADKERV